jgi:hypothetical protein
MRPRIDSRLAARARCAHRISDLTDAQDDAARVSIRRKSGGVMLVTHP